MSEFTDDQRVIVGAKLLYELIKSRHELCGINDGVPSNSMEWEQYLTRGDEIATAICKQALEKPDMMVCIVQAQEGADGIPI